MKKYLFGLMLLAGAALAANMGPYNWDDTGATINGTVAAPGHYISGGVGGITGSTMTASNVKGLLTADATYLLYISTCSDGGKCWNKVGAQ